uniref:Maturin n=1 Tax=Coturnix japonica TaxID=93934 RepID=A0A8C2TLP3_COTJA
MAFEALAEAAERWCARTPFQLIAAEETERRMDFYAEPGVSFYVLCPEAACGDNFAEPWIAQVFSLCSIILFSATAGTSLLETEMWRLQNEKDFVKNMVGCTSGVRVRTAYLFCSSRRITSLPVGKRHSMKYWKKSSNPSDLKAVSLRRNLHRFN